MSIDMFIDWVTSICCDVKSATNSVYRWGTTGERAEGYHTYRHSPSPFYTKCDGNGRGRVCLYGGGRLQQHLTSRPHNTQQQSPPNDAVVCVDRFKVQINCENVFKRYPNVSTMQDFVPMQVYCRDTRNASLNIPRINN